ncbi:MAG: DNA polymerase/3'-5' exonuclease PolX [Telluria sp.]
MPIQNAEVAQVFNEIADLLEIKGDNPFRIRAYREAARTLAGLPQSVQGMLEENVDLAQLHGIGADLSAKIGEIVASGSCELLEQLRTEMPPLLPKLLSVPGLGPRRVKTLFEVCQVETPEQLLQAALDGRVQAIRGFGPKLEQGIIEALQAQRSKERRFRICDALQMIAPLLRLLREGGAASELEVAGSARRARETVGDLDILACSARPSVLVRQFLGYEGVAQVSAKGRTRASVLLRQGMQVDLRVVPQASFGSALHYFTGSRSHNIALRAIARERGLKLNEYGLHEGKRRIAGASEASVFEALGMAFIAPELRENRGEIAAAQAGTLPRLVTLGDLKGDLHAHTSASDGRSSLREMAHAARQAGLEYLAITDHSRALAMAHGLDADALARQIDAIDALNAQLGAEHAGITLLKGVEVDILEDGSLDLPRSVLARLDVVVAAVHSRFGLDRERQTIRMMRAIDHPCCSVLAHPSGRLLLEREAYAVDMERLIRHAGQRGCCMELNSQPSRLDLDGVHCMMARDEGVLISIDSDAHSVFDFANLRFGIGQARRGWLQAGNVLNTRPLAALRDILRRAQR